MEEKCKKARGGIFFKKKRFHSLALVCICIKMGHFPFLNVTGKFDDPVIIYVANSNTHYSLFLALNMTLMPSRKRGDELKLKSCLFVSNCLSDQR